MCEFKLVEIDDFRSTAAVLGSVLNVAILIIANLIIDWENSTESSILWSNKAKEMMRAGCMQLPCLCCFRFPYLTCSALF